MNVYVISFCCVISRVTWSPRFSFSSTNSWTFVFTCWFFSFLKVRNALLVERLFSKRFSCYRLVEHYFLKHYIFLQLRCFSVSASRTNINLKFAVLEISWLSQLPLYSTVILLTHINKESIKCSNHRIKLSEDLNVKRKTKNYFYKRSSLECIQYWQHFTIRSSLSFRIKTYSLLEIVHFVFAFNLRIA